jgi:DDE superfamily endonuclease
LDRNGIEWAYLLLDECTVHLTDAVKEALARNNTDLDYIVPGYTSKLQPLDVGVNEPYKSYMRNNVESYMVISNHGTNAIKIHRRDVANWEAECWELVTETGCSKLGSRMLGISNRNYHLKQLEKIWLQYKLGQTSPQHKTSVGCSKCGFFPRRSGFQHLLLLVDKFY